MGSFLSTEADEEYARAREEWLRPIASGEQLRSQYQDVLGSICLRPEEQSWLKTVFDKFATTPEYWSETDLISFLSLSFPEPSTQLLRDAGPALYRLLRHVGAYPYEPKSTQGLDLKTLRTAIILLMRNDQYHLCQSDYDGKVNEHAARIQRRYLRLIFSALAPISDVARDEKYAGDDEDLVEVLSVIASRPRLRHPTKPKIATPAPQLPSPSSFPASRFNNLSGSLQKADIEPLIRLVLACQLSWANIGPAHFIASFPEDFNKASDAIVDAFFSDTESRCTWQEFQRAMISQQTGIHVGMQQIFRPLIKKPKSLDNEEFISPPAPEAAKSLLSEYRSGESGFSPPGSILNLPLLSQLAMFLSEDLPLDKMTLVELAGTGKGKLQAIKSHVGKSSQGSMLLVTGKAVGQFSSEQVICGSYLPPKDTPKDFNGGEPTIFKCRPIQHIWTGSADKSRARLQTILDSTELVYQLDASTDARAELRISSDFHDVSILFGGDMTSKETSETTVRLVVEAAELLDISVD